ncbi:endoplasmic reticulum protein [Trypanosoma rangeli]|uniref:Endoplasmic reticulum protein n=1 Tax=Trypanosoma rangeli TaxID=5698 RepID=A0A3R7P0U7_TRYRA|nr:endoplasmic reticulum protein [Trypanosoma rangeli]RNF10875.1 endoplasmic reticulum protein [Trypanosoma rangeli]|eukprot:RNF10875.1 endoplasmic reticulum protein [Trypanosoma rangeli]
MFGLTRRLRVGVTVEQVAALVRAKLRGAQPAQNTLLVDVRSTGEVSATGVIPTAVNLPLKLLEAALSDEVGEEEFAETFGVPKPQPGTTQIIFYCAHGVRSSIAVEVVEGLGFSGAGNVTGGFAAWQKYYGELQKNGDSPLTPNP